MVQIQFQYPYYDHALVKIDRLNLSNHHATFPILFAINK